MAEGTKLTGTGVYGAGIEFRGWCRDTICRNVRGRRRVQLIGRADRFLRRISPPYRLKRKHEEELAYWQSELKHLKNWYEDALTDWWGIRPRGDDHALSPPELHGGVVP